MNAQRLNSVGHFARRSFPLILLASLACATTGCNSSGQHEDLTSCLAVLHASRNNAEAIGTLDPDASPTPADRYRGAMDDDARMLNASVVRHPIR